MTDNEEIKKIIEKLLNLLNMKEEDKKEFKEVMSHELENSSPLVAMNFICRCIYNSFDKKYTDKALSSITGDKDIKQVMLFYLTIGEIEEASKYALKVLKNNPTAELYLTLGDIAKHFLSNEDLAIKDYIKAANNQETGESVVEVISNGYYSSAQEYLDKKEYGRAVSLLEISALYGNVNALVCLGYMYETGTGVKTNNKLALEYLKKATSLADFIKEYRPIYNKYDLMTAYNNYGYSLTSDKTNEEALKEAFESFNKAAALGSSIGFYHVGYMYYNGLGVPQDFDEAYKWFTYAANDNCKEAKIALEEMNKNGYSKK